eukprot:TRINITY_DN10580_c0_g1_i1.p1 TRINITY_DN10580_c0_g1~~TRINITY_DN10580_c0_g1_i1.p1  ORF type:complete len:547 (+),score=149.37 TRINITY_DN10580_c0_g1_i1:82-1641(+)
MSESGEAAGGADGGGAPEGSGDAREGSDEQREVGDQQREGDEQLSVKQLLDEPEQAAPPGGRSGSSAGRKPGSAAAQAAALPVRPSPYKAPPHAPFGAPPRRRRSSLAPAPPGPPGTEHRPPMPPPAAEGAPPEHPGLSAKAPPADSPHAAPRLASPYTQKRPLPSIPRELPPPLRPPPVAAQLRRTQLAESAARGRLGRAEYEQRMRIARAMPKEIAPRQPVRPHRQPRRFSGRDEWVPADKGAVEQLRGLPGVFRVLPVSAAQSPVAVTVLGVRPGEDSAVEWVVDCEGKAGVSFSAPLTCVEQLADPQRGPNSPLARPPPYLLLLRPLAPLPPSAETAEQYRAAWEQGMRPPPPEAAAQRAAAAAAGKDKSAARPDSEAAPSAGPSADAAAASDSAARSEASADAAAPGDGDGEGSPPQEGSPEGREDPAPAPCSPGSERSGPQGSRAAEAAAARQRRAERERAWHQLRSPRPPPGAVAAPRGAPPPRRRQLSAAYDAIKTYAAPLPALQRTLPRR